METSASNPVPSTVTASRPSRAVTRLLFVESIRVFLTILVIAHHLMIIYVSPAPDQHGVSRPRYGTCDIGAVESLSTIYLSLALE